MNMPRDILATALDAHEKGIVAIPCQEGTKSPCVKWKEWQTQMPPIELQRDWFSVPSNVAILTTGMVLFDVDDPSFVALVLKHCGETPHMVRTPRGGVHLGYRRRRGDSIHNQVRILRSRRHPDGLPIDLRTDGGLELIPPSQTPDGRYEWLGAGLQAVAELPLARISWTRSRERRRAEPMPVFGDADERTRRAWGYVACIEGAISGQRGHDRAMRVACVLCQKFALSVDEAWPIYREWNRIQCEPPFSEKECLHKLTDAVRLRRDRRAMRPITEDDAGRSPLSVNIYRPQETIDA
jgi:hypothetical protein